MKAFLKEVYSDELVIVMSFDDVVDVVGEGCCGMVLIQMESQNVLVHVKQDQFLVIEK